MFRRPPAFFGAAGAGRIFASLKKETDERWIVKRLSSGMRLNLPMNAQLESMFHVPGLPED